MGVWRSGSASALHAEGLGFDPLVVHLFFFSFVLPQRHARIFNDLNFFLAAIYCFTYAGGCRHIYSFFHFLFSLPPAIKTLTFYIKSSKEEKS